MVDLHNTKNLIGGQLVASESGRYFESVNPADEQVIGRAPEGSTADMNRAVDAALGARRAWAALSITDRAKYLRELASALTEHAETILKIEVMDTGNTIAEMKMDVQIGVDQLHYYAGIGHEMKGQTIPATANNIHLTLRQPYGVVGRIIPFNHPIMFATAKLGAPLIAGNTVVVKPSEQSPLSACYLAELCAKIFPPGVVNIVTGFGKEAGDALVRHPKVKRLAFIGSVETGMMIQRRAAEIAVKNISLELGGKNPMIVFPDADFDKAVAAAVKGMNFGWQGQSCGSTSRLFVHKDIYSRFVAEVAKRVSALKIGDPMDMSSQVGPINNKPQYEKVQGFVATTLKEGGKLIAGGKRPAGKAFEKGYWFEPTVFENMTPDMTLARREVFGPILAVFAWDDIEQTLDIANSLEYGLTGSVWTRDISTALETAQRIESGYIWINGVGAHYPATPFGGFKNSGTGREEALDDMLSYTEEKSINIIL